ncbi:MAG: Hsp20/alpha crystallin family protein [Xenococcaceae cyanobacterium]
MALVRWEPFREMENMQRQMNRLFDRMITYNDSPLEGRAIDEMAFIPAAEIQETPEQVKLRVEIPGVEPGDLDVKVTAEAVSIRGERKSEIKHEEKGINRSEFRYGSFQRIIPLPARIQNDRVQADFKNGVLCLTLPKAEEEKNRVVTISLNGQSQQNNGQDSQAQIGEGQTSQQQNAMGDRVA